MREIGCAHVAETIVCGPDAEARREALREFLEAGFDHVYVQVHQIGPDLAGFLRFYESEILAKVG
jgi:coenzyme F420-dependent glucose-6-phosphate dehydrogenase